MSPRTRLQRLERMKIESDCPACRDRRGRIVLRTSLRQPDGTVVWDRDEPQSCARCGQVPEQIIEVVESVVVERTDAST